MRAKTGTGKASTKSDGKPKKAAAPTARRSEPIIAFTRQQVAKQAPELPKKPGELPTPLATFVF